MFNRILLIAVILGLTACVHIPESLRVDEGVELTEFSNVRANPEQALDQQVRWGGVIAKVTNLEKQTMLEVVHFDLKSSTRPSVKDNTQGRFRLYYQGLLDPVIFKEGRSITALGRVIQSEDGKIGEHEYQYPVMKASYVHLWKEIKQVDVRVSHYPMWHSPSLWYYPRPYGYPSVYRPYTKAKSTKTKNK